MANRQLKLKTAYRPSARLEVFYTGGAACLSSQGLLACACSDEVKVLHITSLARIVALHPPAAAVRGSLRSSDLVAISWLSSCAAVAQIVNVETGAVLATLAGDTEPVTALAWSPSGSRLYSASRSLQQRCWEVPAGGGDAPAAPVRSWRGHKAPILAMALDAEGGLLASAGADRSCRVWDTEGFYCTHAFHGHKCAACLR
jgi:U3 small nucleolar RNA-associated protein 13